MVLAGFDVWLKQGFAEIRGKRIGVVCNHAAVDLKFVHLIDRLAEWGGATIVRILAPEHGFRGALQDMDGVANSVDPKTKIPLVSLYGSTKESLSPKPEHLADLDVVVCDLPDIGTRYYTFAQTIGLLMAAAAPLKIPVIVLDRPNPIDGASVEGARLSKRYRSFCGYAPVPNRHGLTLGELCLIMNNGFGSGDEQIPALGCNLQIIKAAGWSRSSYFDQTGLPWVFPSPNMPTVETAIVYPGMCLFEATNISEGRGTTKPFELIGAPFITGEDWINEIGRSGLQLAGAALRPVSFIPKFQKWADQSCNGVQVHITDRAAFRPFRWALAMIAALHRLYPRQFAWRAGAYEFEDKIPAIDLLYGSDKFRQLVDSGQPLNGLESELTEFEAKFSADRMPFLLY